MKRDKGNQWMWILNINKTFDLLRTLNLCNILFRFVCLHDKLPHDKLLMCLPYSTDRLLSEVPLLTIQSWVHYISLCQIAQWTHTHTTRVLLCLFLQFLSITLAHFSDVSAIFSKLNTKLITDNEPCLMFSALHWSWTHLSLPSHSSLTYHDNILLARNHFHNGSFWSAK